MPCWGRCAVLYRHKLLLATISLFGRALTEADCRRIMLLFSLQAPHEYYQFFFYRGDYRSFLLHHDLESLRASGSLQGTARLRLQAAGVAAAAAAALRADDRARLAALEQEVEERRGRALQERVLALCPPRLSLGKGDEACLFTLGYEGLTLDGYLALLLEQGVALLVDVRRNPLSHKYGFSKARLSQALETVGIDYLHLPALGVPSVLRQNLRTASAYEALFAHYRSTILSEATEALARLKEALARAKRVALTCFEADPACCHRSVLVEHLRERSILTMPVVHLRAASRSSQGHAEPSVSSSARETFSSSVLSTVGGDP